MDELVFAVEGEGPRREWWVGGGLWWLLIEGFGVVWTYDPMKQMEGQSDG